MLTGELEVPRLETTVLGRDVSLESLRVSLDKSLRVELRGARLGNVPGGSKSDMVRLASLNAELDADPLMSGSVVVRRAEVDGLSLLLEHNARHQANWRFGQDRAATAARPRRPSRASSRGAARPRRAAIGPRPHHRAQ